MIRILSADPLPHCRLKVTFNDGFSGIFSVEPGQRGVRRVVVKAPAELPYLLMGWKCPVLRDVDRDAAQPGAHLGVPAEARQAAHLRPNFRSRSDS